MAADKRRNKRKQQPVRRAWWPGMLMLVCVLGSATYLGHYYLTQPGRLPLRVVEVTGEFSHLKRAEVEQRVAESIDGGFFTVDMNRVREAVLAMPWVAEVSVRRVWPDTLRMQVSEQLPLARWGEDALVNLHGEVFEPQAMPSLQGLATLRGESRHAPRMVDFYLRLRARLADTGLRIARLEFNARQQWQIDFYGDLQLLLGSEKVEQRLHDFLRVFPQLASQMTSRPQRIDMRYEHGFAVRWAPAADGATALSGTTTGDS